MSATIFVTNTTSPTPRLRRAGDEGVLPVQHQRPQELQKVDRGVPVVTSAAARSQRRMPSSPRQPTIALAEDHNDPASRARNRGGHPGDGDELDNVTQAHCRHHLHRPDRLSFNPRPGLKAQDAKNNPPMIGAGPTTTTTTTSSNLYPALQPGPSVRFSIILPDALLQAVLSDAQTKVLQSPQLRSIDNQKATLKIGDRQPTATGSFQPGIGGVGINPLVNTQFTYIDVGVNVDLTPRVHDNGEVSMHVEVEISSVNGKVNLGASTSPSSGSAR
jgi:hypothetical protein